jgi:hypothetical protein
MISVAVAPLEVAADAADPSLYESRKRSICIPLDMREFLAFFGALQTGPYVCSMNSFFETMRSSGYSPVVLRRAHPDSAMRADVMLVPSKKGYRLCVVQMGFDGTSRIAPEEDHVKHCFTTPDSFTSDGNVQLRDSWFDFQRQMFAGNLGGDAGNVPMSSRGKVLAQNSVSEVQLDAPDASDGGTATASKVQIFATGDPETRTHWLQQVRIAAHWDGDGKAKSVSAMSTPSVPSVTTVRTYHSCDRMSCLGCASLKLQALCYAAQQCSVVQCVGTVVNQNRPLCNVGLVLKSHADTVLSTSLGAWLIFTETYTSILDNALLGPSEGFGVEWVDDAFFGYVCTAKDMLGQGTAILTSSIGAALVTSEKKVRAMMDEGDISGALKHDISDDAFTAGVTMAMSGINSFMYQLVMLPLYILVAMQKTMVCTAKDVFAVFDETGFVVRVGRGDLQAASSVAAGVCLTEAFSSGLEAMGETDAPQDMADSANDVFKGFGNAAVTIKMEQDETARAKRYLDIVGSKKMGRGAAGGKFADSVRNSVSRGGKKAGTFFSMFKNTKVVKAIGGVFGKLQIKMPVHMIDSVLTYAIGVVSGMQDLVQVRLVGRPCSCACARVFVCVCV